MWHQRWFLGAWAWRRAGVESGGPAEMTGSKGMLRAQQRDGVGASVAAWVRPPGKPRHPGPTFPLATPHLLSGVGHAVGQGVGPPVWERPRRQCEGSWS